MLDAWQSPVPHGLRELWQLLPWWMTVFDTPPVDAAFDHSTWMKRRARVHVPFEEDHLAGTFGPAEEVEDCQTEGGRHQDIFEFEGREAGPEPQLAPEVVVQGRHWSLDEMWMGISRRSAGEALIW
jgi:hypothetical protein